MEVKVSFERTVQVKQFEPEKISVEISGTVDGCLDKTITDAIDVAEKHVNERLGLSKGKTTTTTDKPLKYVESTAFKDANKDMKGDSAITTEFKKQGLAPKQEFFECPKCHIPYKSEEAVRNHICPKDS